MSASETEIGETWKVEVYPTDSNGIAGPFQIATWYTIGDSDNDGILDENDDYPNDAERAFINHYPALGKNTLAFEDRWPEKGDYDMNDLVLYYHFTIITNAENNVKQIKLDTDFVSRGGDQYSAFAMSFPGVDSNNVANNSRVIDGQSYAIQPEAGHTDELVYVLIDDSHLTLPSNASFDFYNTQGSDERAIVTLNFDVSFTDAVATSKLGTAPFNPFILQAVSEEERYIFAILHPLT